MKIVFLCGSLEPGRDGVGDYTRRLAVELIQSGYSVSVMALNDTYLKDRFQYAESVDGVTLPVYRIPSSWNSLQKFRQANVWLDEINPDWLSLQFVIYSFHPKGIPFGLGKHLAMLVKGRRFHLMFHEIWVGFTKVSPLKHRIIGFIQRRIIKSILKPIKADLITTTNGLYQSVLIRSNIQSQILPLFSNITVVKADQAFTTGVFEQLGIVEQERYSWRIIGFFGSLYPDSELEQAITEQLKAAQEDSKSLTFIGLGRTDESGMKEFARLKILFAGSVQFRHFGELPAEEVSRLFQIMDMGISCTPKQHVGKSGVFAAMKSHGLDVLIPSEKIIPEYSQEIKQDYKVLMSRSSEEWNVSYISGRFLHLLN